jgi:hypothetical protein
MPTRRSVREEYKDFTSNVPDALPQEIKDLIEASFYAGATGMFTMLTTGMDEDAEPTQADLDWMSSVHDELEKFSEEFKSKFVGIARRERR